MLILHFKMVSDLLASLADPNPYGWLPKCHQSKTLLPSHYNTVHQSKEASYEKNPNLWAWHLMTSLLLLLLSRFSHVWLCATPETAAHQAPLSLGISRQKYWSGLPFPSPMHVWMLSRFSCVRFCETPWTAAHQAPPSTEFSRQVYWSRLPFPSPIPCLTWP